MKKNELCFEQLDLTDRNSLVSSLPTAYKLGCEIGVWEGAYTSVLLANASMHIVAIDPWVSTDSYGETYGSHTMEDIEKNPQLRGNDGFVWQETRYIATLDNLKRFPLQRWTVLRGYSYKLKHFFSDGGLDFVYIDGEHCYEAVSQDIADWWPKISSGGILAGHDYNDTNPGSIRAVDEHAQTNSVEFKITGTSPEKGDADAPSWVFIKK